MDKDSRGQSFIVVGNLRITFVPAANRSSDKNWSGEDVIRIQAYVDPSQSSSLHKGAEIPIADHGVFVDLIRGLCEVYNYGTRGIR